MVEIRGQVDVPSEARLAHDAQRQTEAPRLGAVAPERPRAVGEPEPDSRRDAGDVRAVVVTVGHERDAVVPAQATRGRARWGRSA